MDCWDYGITNKFLRRTYLYPEDESVNSLGFSTGIGKTFLSVERQVICDFPVKFSQVGDLSVSYPQTRLLEYTP